MRSCRRTATCIVIIDNYGTHKAPKVIRWFVRHPRYHLHFASTSASSLVMARRDGKIGPQLRRAETDCASVGAPSPIGVGPSPEGGPPSCGFFGFAPGTKFSDGRGGFAFRGLTMAALAKTFVPILRRNVIDRTGLTGYHDGDFDFIAEFPLPPPPAGVPNPFEAPFGSVFAVFPDQLGLKFESTRGPVEVLVIDNLERPTPE